MRREKKSILYRWPSLLTSVPSFSLIFLESRKPNPHYHNPHLHRRNRRSTAGLHVPRISSPLSALQDLAMNQDFLAAEANGRRCHFNTDNPWFLLFPFSSLRVENQTHIVAVLISIDAAEDPLLGFTFLESHLHYQHSKT